ncbi:MAG: gliding motility-associated C-terminal domain-containing protein [Bacteroidia bacterium]|nr:gliding motility-associated C-terminal domain-containing protein [Bacteroidia bacterium]
MKNTANNILRIYIKGTAFLIVSMLVHISIQAQEASTTPPISKVSIILDALSCEETLTHAEVIAEDFTTTDPNTGLAISQKQKLTYTWLMADSVVYTSNYSEASLPVPLDTCELRLVVKNQFNAEAEDIILLPSWGVEAKYKINTRDRDIPHEVSTPTALSAPVDVEFENLSRGNYTVSEWLMGSLTRLFDENPVYQFQSPGEYRISLIVTNENSGCSHADSSEVIIVTDADIQFPDAFTPNGDGVNDEFRPAYKSIKDYKLTIYNRWGRRVFSSTNPKVGWDGKNGNTDAAEGVYIYICEATAYERGVAFTRKGTVTLIR